ncbi:tyrosinase family protein [Dyella acidiphila]|uniref:Tyrosinase family protein n=1 Tax=Dyella acidiphila TaxID=2775866 RepID=A0ABR9GBI0_9GAMM|nr:tyrosinase family protein [Dyella acidiphila]MBE1161395.1 tyrosinase family protein [Dyella acidiphila]
MNSRRRFLKSSLTVAMIPLLPDIAFADEPRAAAAAATVTRPSWSVFRSGPLYSVYVETIRKMRANTNASDPNSWFYWANVHQNFCPHGIAYFLAWHRGYLHLFEQKLREISRNNALIVPYWDYYTDPKMPNEFLDTSSPLYIAGRRNNNVHASLSLDPFANNVINFPQGMGNAFEPSVESRPHNAVHNIIGGVMANLQSPQDPIFWVHHANIDRLWAAWVKAGGGRTMPAPSSSYWSGIFNYAPGVTMPRNVTISTVGLGYQYENENMPNRIPPAVAPARPPLIKLKALAPKLLGAQTLGGGEQLSLDQKSVSVEVPVSVQQQPHLRTLLKASSQAANANPATVRVVLNGVSLTELGQSGGYYYKVFIDLPERANTEHGESDYLLGTLGPFEIAGLQHHAEHGGGQVQLSFPATDALQQIKPEKLDKLTISFVRVDGDNPVNGTVINIKEFRVEADNAPSP